MELLDRVLYPLYVALLVVVLFIQGECCNEVAGVLL
jgi:hypothetical protein